MAPTLLVPLDKRREPVVTHPSAAPASSLGVAVSLARADLYAIATYFHRPVAYPYPPPNA